LSDKKSIFWYELVGMVFVIFVGSILHFTFEWSGNQPVIGVFSAVNESVWEHLKIAFWPSLLYLILEYRFVYRKSNNFYFAKTLGIYSIMIIIPVIFYSYTIFLEENLIIDIGSFIFAIILGQIVSYKLLIYQKISKKFELFGIIALIILALAFVIFTFYPPQVTFFQDPVTGEYGIVDQSIRLW
jgi:hypothetical protein